MKKNLLTEPVPRAIAEEARYVYTLVNNPPICETKAAFKREVEARIDKGLRDLPREGLKAFRGGRLIAFELYYGTILAGKLSDDNGAAKDGSFYKPYAEECFGIVTEIIARRRNCDRSVVIRKAAGYLGTDEQGLNMKISTAVRAALLMRAGLDEKADDETGVLFEIRGDLEKKIFID